MKKLLARIVLAGVAAGCSSGGSSVASIDRGTAIGSDPTPIPPPTEPGPPMAPSQPPPNAAQNLTGCPSQREASTLALTGADDVRTRLVGIYRGCQGGTGLELRIDPESDTRLLWYALDDRYVRLPPATTTRGFIDVGECDGPTCTVTWGDYDGEPDDYAPTRKLSVWEEPTAITVATDINGPSWTEYLRIAD